MRRLGRRFGALILAGLVPCVLVAACGGSKPTTADSGGTVTLLMSAPPGSLDPAVAGSAEAFEPDWLAYTPLLTYDHSNGVPGTLVIPGLATDFPTISDGGRTYTLILRPGIVYSNGQAVKASDFTWAVERAIKLHWAGAREMITSRIAGAAAFAAGRAKTISGISTDDATGQVTIQLIAPYGPFENVLALPAMAPVPSGTPFRDEQSDPPPGVGPYKLADVVPGRSFELIRNPVWHHGMVPGVPTGHVDVAVRITGDPEGNALAVLGNSADVFDPSDQIPPALLPRIKRQASARYSKQAVNGTYLIFMNVTRKPFSNQQARAAVQTALDENALKRLAPGTLQEGCYVLPPSMYGHPHDQCPRGNIEKGGDPGAARSLVSQSGMAGTPVTVWGQAGAPFAGWMAYYTSLLNRIGFKARLKLIPAASYYDTIGTLKLHPQTGFGDVKAQLPAPADFYQRLTDSAIRARGNTNWGEIDDPYVNDQVRILGTVPSFQLGAVASFWHAVERHVARAAYVAVLGYQAVPKFVSDRISYSRLVLSPVAGFDWTSFHLK